ncbi:hypothetical protein AVEN_192104-1 [Araneus ventricosus]|uniref:Uncharacterized protein n=1 Tax=Araneus ventricosus TaxID=182803 RepID=A0A4Y2B9H6_ARAVE|nr:hypothetical protein AVEN_192104-1 [Araneus ventricosus]
MFRFGCQFRHLFDDELTMIFNIEVRPKISLVLLKMGWPTFGFRIGEILRTFKIQDFPVVVSINAPPWQEEHFDFIDDFENFLKKSTSDMIFQKLFYEHRQRYHNFIPVYTDGSKFEDNVGSAAVFPDIEIAENLTTG